MEINLFKRRINVPYQRAFTPHREVANRLTSC